MNFDWKARLKNPLFWVAVIPTVAELLYSLLSFVGIVPKISREEAVNIALAVVSLLSTIGVLVDPTTKGISDGTETNETDTEV